MLRNASLIPELSARGANGSAPSPHDIADLRSRLADGSGPALWRSLEAVAETPAFRDFLAKEFPSASKLADGPDRRQFFRLMAASFAMAGLSACSDQGNPRNVEIPYVRNPERVEPSAPLTYTSTTLLDGYGNGATVTTFDGRPLKIEGNSSHPWSRGGSDIFAQASILDLYDPLRSQAVRYLDRISSWQDFQGAMVGRFGAIKADGGEGLRLLTGPITSPTLLAQIDALKQVYPKLRWHDHAPVGGAAAEGAEAAFGRKLLTRYGFDKAQVVVALDGDFLDHGPHQIGMSRDWIDARLASARAGRLLTLHSAAATPSLTSAKADYHVAVGTAELAGLVGRLQAAIVAPTAPAEGDLVGAWVARAAAALAAARGGGIVTAGTSQPAAVHEAVHRLNDSLGNNGEAVFFTAPVVAEAEPFAALVSDMMAGSVKTLVMLDTNPAYTAPADLNFAQALEKVPLRIHTGLTVDETAVYADWHLPMSHPLESWGDARSYDGTVSLYQPTIQTLYNGRSNSEVLSMLGDAQPRAGLTILRDGWRKRRDDGGADPAGFDVFWRKALIDGFVADTGLMPESVALVPPKPAAGIAIAEPGFGTAASAGGKPALDVVFRPDPSIWSGAFANNGWLQELPKPLTKVVWDNVVALSPALAEREKLANGDMVSIAVGEASIDGPVWILPGQAADTVTLFLGYGRAVPDMLFSGLGYSAYRLRQEASPWRRPGATLTKLGRSVRLATTQDHSTMEGHDFVQVHRIGAPEVDAAPHDMPSFYDFTAKDNDGRAWGMVIDQDSCIGCNACVVACQAENNIPIVGKEQVAVGREMHWLRIDRYYSGLKTGAGLDDPDTHFQPVPCMHCEDAPCEVGCPVEATLHDQEGLNLMVYNRCIGTRACSGYCPYKVRHFNYLDYTGGMAPATQLQRNPEVSVRSRGVMEKCTYCVQRIALARIESDKSGAPIADGSVKTACQAACPTRAITFGDLNDKGSAVRAARHDARNYPLLGELNVKPRTTYLAELAPADPAAHAGDPATRGLGPSGATTMRKG